MQPADPRSRPARGTGELLITGATGFIGQVLARELGRLKIRFRALVRVTSQRDRLEGSGAWMVEGDLRNPRSLVGPLEGVRQIVHLGALVRSADPADNQAVNAAGTANLLAAASAEGVERIVALSSDSVLRAQHTPYARSKAEAEAKLLAWGQHAGQSALVLRPPMILGPQSKHLQTFVKLSRLPVLPLPRRTASRCPVFVDDVVAAILAALALDEAAVPQVPIDLPGATHLDFGALIAAVAASQGRKGPAIRRVPGAALRGLSRLAGPQAAQQLRGIEEEVVLDGTLAEQLLNWQPTPLSTLLERSLKP
jgi:nucleoside-diphosphate-sugar epimerase